MPDLTVKIGERPVGRIGLGTNRIQQDEESYAVLRHALERGVGLVDTADVYTGGVSEQVIGELLTPFPGLIATKGGFVAGYEVDGSPSHLAHAVDSSLRKLRMPTIELYYLHRVDPKVEIEESVGALDAARKAGKIRHIGLSAVSVEQIERARKVAPITAVQNDYSVLTREGDDVLEYCEREGIVFVAFFPLGKGSMHSNGALSAVAQRHGISASQVALAWLLHRSPAIVAIPGTRSPAHLDENLAAGDVRLSVEDLAELEQA